MVIDFFKSSFQLGFTVFALFFLFSLSFFSTIVFADDCYNNNESG